jgi:hypothetical protein
MLINADDFGYVRFWNSSADTSNIIYLKALASERFIVH